jgi:4-amino-4-deoxy-L-arabinose transferase-like glycosyltransferase
MVRRGVAGVLREQNPALSDPGFADAKHRAPKSLRDGGPPHFGILFCLTWIIVVVGLFSLAKTKLPSYVTPCYPALAVLVGNLVARWTSGELAISRLWLRASLACYVVVGIAVAAVVYFLAEHFLPGEQWLAGIGVVLVAGGVASSFFEGLRKEPIKAAGLSIATGGLFSLLLMGLGPAAADRHQQSHLLLEAVRQSGQPQVAALHCLEPSWVFYLGRPIHELPGGMEEAVRFLAADEGLVILREQELPKLAENTRLNVEVVGRAPLFLKDEALVVVRCGGPIGTARREEGEKR